MNYECPVNSSLRNASIFRKYPKHQNVQSPPVHFAMVMYIMIICHGAILLYNISFQTIAGRSDGVL